MRNKRIIIIILSILILGIIIIETILLIKWFKYRSLEQERTSREQYIERYYKIVRISANKNGISHVYTMITTRDDKIIDTRVVKRGYNPEGVKKHYEELKSLGTIVYNIETGETNLIKNIDPYMHSNCITFIDEQTVVTYDENGHSYLINILTNEVRTLDKYPLEGTIVNIEYSDETIKLTNIITGAVSRIDYHFYGTNYMGTYCSIDYLVLFNNEKLYLYDIESNQLVDLDPQKELDDQLKEVMIIDQKHLLITTDKRAYIVANVGNNG